MVVNVFSSFFEIRGKIVNSSITEPPMFPCVEFGDFGQFEDFALRAAILDECQIYLGGGGRFRPGRINVER